MHLEHILVDSWRKLVDELGGRVVYRTTDEVPAFFREIEGTGRDVVLVSGSNDSGLYVQAEAHPNEDLPKLAASVDWQLATRQREFYASLQIGPACVEGRDPSHRYSLKTDRFTWGTFDRVPDEVRHWFTTNLNCRCPRTYLIPFGLNNAGPGASMVSRFMGRRKKALLYVNFQLNSLERVRLKDFYRGRNWVTYRESPNLPVDQYLDEMADHRFVLCPAGNGLDCYRIWEALYLGCVPVLEDSHFARTLQEYGLPVMAANGLAFSQPDGIEEEFQLYQDGLASGMLSMKRADLRYWRDVLRTVAD